MSIQELYEKNKNNSFKILLSLYNGNYAKLALAGFFFAIKHMPAWILPIIIAKIIDISTNPSLHSLNEIYFSIAIMIVLVLQNILSNYYHTKFHSKAIRSVEANLRSSIIKKLQELSITYQKEMQSGKIQSKIMRDVEAVQTLSSQLFVSTLNITINLIVALGITIYKSKVVFLFFIVTVPVSALIIVAFRKKMMRRNSDFRGEMEQTSAKVIEMIELLPISRAHALEEQEIDKMNKHIVKIAKKGFKLDIIQSVFGSVGWAVFQIFQLACLGFTGTLAFNGKITAGDVVMYQTYFTIVVAQVSGIITLIPTIAKGMDSVASIGEILTESDVEKNEGKKKVKDIKGDFLFEDIDYIYPNAQQKILNGFNIHIKQGETIAIVGQSGAGKSTILNLVIGFIRPTKGRILLDGQDMESLDLRSFRNYLSVVPQNTILFSGTIRDNIKFGLESVNEEKLEEVIKYANLWDVIQNMPDGLDTVIGEHGDKLSGGQRQRISIARALIRNPKIIIFDEATSALDSISELKVQESLKHLSKGRTTFIVAHRLSTIKGADKIAVLEAGKCIEFGTHEELMELRGGFYNMKKLQS
jgi:ATP-binding cassette, subfamily B, bacterial